MTTLTKLQPNDYLTTATNEQLPIKEFILRYVPCSYNVMLVRLIISKKDPQLISLLNLVFIQDKFFS